MRLRPTLATFYLSTPHTINLVLSPTGALLRGGSLHIGPVPGHEGGLPGVLRKPRARHQVRQPAYVHVRGKKIIDDIFKMLESMVFLGSRNLWLK